MRAQTRERGPPSALAEIELWTISLAEILEGRIFIMLLVVLNWFLQSGHWTIFIQGKEWKQKTYIYTILCLKAFPMKLELLKQITSWRISKPIETLINWVWFQSQASHGMFFHPISYCWRFGLKKMFLHIQVT